MNRREHTVVKPIAKDADAHDEDRQHHVERGLFKGSQIFPVSHVDRLLYLLNLKGILYIWTKGEASVEIKVVFIENKFGFVKTPNHVVMTA